jgi:phosphatidate cytidylyltransferase
MRLGLRVASAAVLLALVLIAVVLGGVVFDVVLGIAAAIALFEYLRLMDRVGAPPPWWVLFPLGGWLLYRFLLPGDVPALEWGLGAATVVGLVGGVVAGRRGSVAGWAAAVGGALWIGLCAGYYLALLRWPAGTTLHEGLRIVLITLGSAMLGDTAALFAGTAVGRHPFFRRASPRKTVEGAAAGALVTVAAWGATAPGQLGLAWYHGVAIGALVAVAAQGGDLAESALKRAAGVKDSGALIPGHGGLLDRLDSLLFLGPVVYCYLRLVALP